MSRSPLVRPFPLTLLALLLLLLWDASGLDLVLARAMGTPLGFPWRDNWFLVNVMHEGAKALSWVLTMALFVAIPWPFGALRRLGRSDRVQLAISALASVAVISLMKRASSTSCPWDLQVFGGAAQYVSHWSWGMRDGGGGNCFPAGHASAAFAYMGGYFAWRRTSPSIARGWLACSMIAGLALGLAQQWRGAHFMSHTLWTAWLCWVTGYVIELAMRWRAARSTGDAARQRSLNGT
ncbi:phosphatase PAP2 family protein [Variovorax sp. Sphag1AA]|uniref:phosphatase PAP2 family protein n=1 Tax=Variovorax sp. Sphag1AA TaxID=2587027 RepID=UPI001615E65C|nr:phosphatase PAP2 family protein [Variovorax sp. Sphag1AA]MBB3175771.1 membrane-associated PAP2 superfamily phosphatase [Variovorax sp. Sphag1AA]